MKAIYIPGDYIDKSILDGLNKELKDCHTILEKISHQHGTILIIDKYTRFDKLKKINELSETTPDNSL